MDTTLYNNVLTEEEWRTAVTRTWAGANWRYGASSNDSQQDLKFWIMELSNDPFFSQHLMQKVATLTNRSWRLLRVYANGQTHGLSGSLHQDTNNVIPGLHYTFLYYANPEWRPEWGGHTIFTDASGVRSIYPTPNSAVLFDAAITHAGLEPTRHCQDLRVTIAFKLEAV